MADEREGQGIGKSPATDDKIQSPGRKENDAKPLNAAPDDGGPERYPSVRQDDAVERTGRAEQVTGESRSFEPPRGAPTPKQGAGDTTAPQPTNAGKVGPDGKPAQGSRQAGYEGPQGDPAEGKR